MQRAFRDAILLLLMVGGAHPATADFRVTAVPQPPAISDTPHVSPDDVPGYVGRRVPRTWHPKITGGSLKAGGRQSASAKIVRGFGAGVPLSFACRQIIPATISVIFSDDVDPETPVNWTGGRAWAAVLRDALRPAGLVIVPHGTTIEIRK